MRMKLLSAFFACVLSGCASGGADAGAGIPIGPDGGTITWLGGSLTIPPGALQQTIYVGVETLGSEPAPSGGSNAGRSAVRLTPESPGFDRAASVRFDVEPSVSQRSDLSLAARLEMDPGWTSSPVLRLEGQATGFVWRLSTLMLVAYDSNDAGVDGGGDADAGSADAGSADAGRTDAGAPGGSDAGGLDAGSLDAGGLGDGGIDLCGPVPLLISSSPGCGCLPLNAACYAGNDCASGLCFNGKYGKVCTQECPSMTCQCRTHCQYYLGNTWVCVAQ
jgi:hypothetical protein